MVIPVSYGCYLDVSYNPDLTGHTVNEYSTLTVELCLDLCRSLGFPWAGTRYAYKCSCDNSYGTHGIAPLSDCDSDCRGNSLQFCGGSYRNTIYSVGKSSIIRCFLRRWLLGFTWEKPSQVETSQRTNTCVLHVQQVT